MQAKKRKPAGKIAAVFGLAAALAVSGPAFATELLSNGSLEDLNGDFVNQSDGFMALYAGSTAIADWTVSPDTISDIAWGYGPDAGFPAGEGDYYVDLTGFGNNSPNGAIRQTVSVTPGQTYTVGFLWADISTGDPGVDIDGVPVSLHTPTGYNYNWTYVEGTFVAGLDPTPYLEFYNASPGTDAMVIDAGSLTLTSDSGTGGNTGGSGSNVPEPSGVVLLTCALAGLGAVRFRRSAGTA